MGIFFNESGNPLKKGFMPWALSLYLAQIKREKKIKKFINRILIFFWNYIVKHG